MTDSAPQPAVLPRIYADFNGYGSYQRRPDRETVPLDTYGSLCDLAAAGIVLREGMRLTIYSDSDAAEDLEADTEVYFDRDAGCWMAEIDENGYRHVPTRPAWPPDLVCVRCGEPWHRLRPPAAIVEGMEMRVLHVGDRCAACGERIHRPIDPP